MAEKFTRFDPAELLSSSEAIEVFLADAFETENSSYIAVALNDVVRANGVEVLSKRTGLSCEQLQQSLREGENLTLKTTLALLDAVGLTLTVAPTRTGAGNATSTLTAEGDPVDPAVHRTGDGAVGRASIER